MKMSVRIDIFLSIVLDASFLVLVAGVVCWST